MTAAMDRVGHQLIFALLVAIDKLLLVLVVIAGSLGCDVFSFGYLTLSFFVLLNRKTSVAAFVQKWRLLQRFNFCLLLVLVSFQCAWLRCSPLSDWASVLGLNKFWLFASDSDLAPVFRGWDQERGGIHVMYSHLHTYTLTHI